MLTRNQFRLTQRLRGLIAEDIIHQTGIPAQSLMALMGAQDKEEKDHNKLTSVSTMNRVADLLGVEQNLSGLRTGKVLHWKFDKLKRKGEVDWSSAFGAMAKELFSEDVQVAEVRGQRKGWFAQRPTMIYVRDNIKNVRIVVTNPNKAARNAIESALARPIERTEVWSKTDFDLNLKLVENGVYRTSAFDFTIEGKLRKYTWDDVKAAAKEFNCSPQDIIDLMVENVRNDETTQEHQPYLLRAVSVG